MVVIPKESQQLLTVSRWGLVSLRAVINVPRITILGCFKSVTVMSINPNNSKKETVEKAFLFFFFLSFIKGMSSCLLCCDP